MPQLHLYVSDEVAEKVRERAAAFGLSVSRYLAEIVSRDISSEWPEGYFEYVIGGWKGDPLERSPQGDLDDRDEL